MFFVCAVPLFLAIPIWICMAISANNRAKRLAAIARATMLNDARLVKQVAHLPNSGVMALDVARADQVLAEDARSNPKWMNVAGPIALSSPYSGVRWCE
jgi:hypothetical protein